ncbi:MAG: BCCT family transporter [Eubacterium sp.]
MKGKVDWITIVIPFALISVFCALLIVFPSTVKEGVNALYAVVTQKFGFVYLWITLLSFLFCIYLALSKYGKIKLGEGDKEYSEFSWASMIFCASMAAGFLYWTNIEWTYYYKAPPFGITPFSVEAMEYAGAYPLFHWGPSAWSLYLIPAIAFAYSFYNRKNSHLDIAGPCLEVFGKKHQIGIRRVFNIIFIIGMIGGAGTTLGIGTPVTTAALSALFGIEDSGMVRFVTLCVITLIFTLSTYAGIKKGMKRLSDFNVGLLFAILLCVFIFTDQEFVIRMASTSVGILVSDFFRMSTWMDPVTGSGFTETWTVFYWAWWLSIALSVGLFIAKISKGRTIRQVILGCLGYGFPMTFLFFSVLGGNSMNLFMTQKLDVITALEENGGAAAVTQIFSQSPLGNIVLILVLVASIILTATTYDSVSHTLAMTSSVNALAGEEPAQKLRVFWAVSMAAIPAIMMLFDGTLQEIQTLTIIFTLPVCILYVIITAALFKMLKQDHPAQ